MSKKSGDKAKNSVRSVSEIAHSLVADLPRKDARHEYFWNYRPIDRFMGPYGFFRTKKQTAIAFGANRSSKTTAAVFKCVMIYTGLIPPSMQNVYGHEKVLRSISRGGKYARPRGVRIIVMDYTNHWPLVIQPMLLGDPSSGAKGMLPETWSDFDKNTHTFYGPDGSYMNIFALNPHESTFPYGLRGLECDHTWMDEINRYEGYTESLVRGGALKHSMKTVDLTFCPQHGYECYTYKKFFLKTHDPKTQDPLPPEKRDPNISMTRVSMRDNPSLSKEQIKKFIDAMEPWEVAFRVDGNYSQRAENPFFNMEMLVQWQSERRSLPGVPFVIEQTKVDERKGIFEGRLIQKNEGEVDERIDIVWWIWELPKHGQKYIVPADPSLGHLGGDPHAVGVWNATNQQFPYQVAQYRGYNIRPGELAIQSAIISKIYGGSSKSKYALVVPERNGTGGGAFIERIRNHKNLYTALRGDKRKEQQTEELGFNLDRYNKENCLSDAYHILRFMYAHMIPDGKGGEWSFCPIRSEITLGELMSFQVRLIRKKIKGMNDSYGPVGKVEYGARAGSHDDTVDEMVMAFRIIKHEYKKIKTCLLEDNMLNNKHLRLDKSSEKKKKGAFSSMRKQPSIRNLRNNLYRGV